MLQVMKILKQCLKKPLGCFSHLDGVINNAGLGGESLLEK